MNSLNTNSFAKPGFHKKNLNFTLLLAGLGFIIVTFIIMLLMAGTAHAAGGVGSGGTGGGGGTGDEAHWSDRGYGWVRYNVSGPGPSDGFRNGLAWSSAQSTCSDTTYVYAFIVYDNFQKGKVYSYEGWNNPANLLDSRFGVGASVDHGRAVTMTIGTAEAAFNSIDDPPYNVNTSGYGFRNGTMGWFCYGYIPPANPPSGSFSADCSFVRVRDAIDPDRPSAQLRVRLYINGVDRGLFNTNSSHDVDISVSSYADFASNSYRIVILGRNASNGEDGINRDLGTRTVGACVTIACGGVETIPDPPISGSSVQIRVRFNFNRAVGANGTGFPYRVRLTTSGGLSPSNFSNTSIATGTVAAGSSQVVATSPSRTAIGPFTVTDYRLENSSSGALIRSCGGPTIVPATQPYFRVYNGDISAGISTTCSVTGWARDTTANIRAINTSGAGSGAQLAAFAISTIQQFTSATGRGSAPTNPKGLTFANTGGGAGGTAFGGGWGGNCPFDYFNDPVTNLGATPAPGGPIGGFSVGAGTKTVWYASGGSDIVINDNITYGGAPWNIDNIPNFTLIVDGDIFIDNNVTELDGVYVASGNIYTCSVSNAPPNSTQLASDIIPLADSCKHRNILGAVNKLTLNGALIARNIKLQRSGGNVANSSSTQPSSSGDISEVFIFNPAIWLSAPSSPGDRVAPYESITSLPPVL